MSPDRSIRPSVARSEAPLPSRIGSRFDVRRLLGRGGMGVVYEVVDAGSGRACALKRLDVRADAKKQRRATQLFEREYHRLSQLAHPRVVQVYEYAIDAVGPYYTMELLDGGDLQQIAPVPWRRACAIARDVCSALSLLHSRQTVHRDLSPRNVRCAADGSAKLIDFGVMAPFGTNRLVVGTPPGCAPEIVALQTIDARTDLYALGATLYFTLVGHHAYPARSFAGLASLWREPLQRPSQYDADIPQALDALVLSLLRLDPDARPSSAAEVMQRLSAIDGCPIDEGLLVAQSYLSTPTLVGRAKPLGRARSRLKRALQDKSSAIAVTGPSGVGRSRFVDACVLEATLLGLTVVRVAADTAQSGDWGAVRSIASVLLKVLPDEVLAAARPELEILGHAVPELAARAPGTELIALDAERLRPRLQQAVRQWLLRLSKHKPLLIAIDDLQRVDEPSATLLALLALDLHDHALVLIASLELGAPALAEASCKLFAQAGLKLTLDNLSSEDVELLLRSLFGEAPNVDFLAHRLWALASGNPRDTLRLCQHLLDRGVLWYRAGTWTLPETLSPDDLPVSATQAQRARVEALSEPARRLATGLALCPDLSFSNAECELLMGADGGVDANDVQAELLRAAIVREVRDTLTLAHPSWEGLLCGDLSQADEQHVQARIAEALRTRDDQVFRVGKHLLLAGQTERGLKVLIEHARVSQEETIQNEPTFLRYVRSLPPDWQQVFHRALRLCESCGRPPRERFYLLSRLAGILAILAIDDREHIGALLTELARYSGLADYAQLDPNMEPMARLTAALQQTQARYDAASEEERVLDPLTAIRQLARGVIAASSLAALSMDVNAVRALPSLAPLIPLSPALALVDLLWQGMYARYSGRFERTCAVYEEILHRTAQPDLGGLDATHSGYMRMGVMNALGMVEAGLGRASCLQYAQTLEQEPTHRVNALQIRMLYHLWQGDSVQANQCKRSVERVRIENSAKHWFEGAHLFWEVTAYGLSGDLMRIKHAREELAPLAKQYPAWFALDCYAGAQYQRARGDHEAAHDSIKRALQLTAAGEHASWAYIAALHLQTLSSLGSDEEALSLGSDYLRQAERAEQGYHCEHLHMVLAAIEAKCGRLQQARDRADAVLQRLSAANITGLNLALAHETRARVAIAAQDLEAFGRHARQCREVYHGRRNAALTARYDKLVRDGRRQTDGERKFTLRRTPDSDLFSPSRMHSALDSCKSPQARAAVALSLLIEHSHCHSGMLFTLDERGPRCIASVGEDQPCEQTLEFVRVYAAQQRDEDGDTTDSDSGDSGFTTTWRDEDSGQRFRPVLLSHYERGALVISAVALLAVVTETSFVYPAQIASALSRYTNVDSGHALQTQHD